MNVVRILFLICLAPFLVSFKPAPTEEQLRKLLIDIEMLQFNRNKSAEEKETEIKKMLDEADKQFSLEEVEGKQMLLFFSPLKMSRSKVYLERITPMMNERMADPNIGGALATCFQIYFNMDGKHPKIFTKDVLQLFEHPSFPELCLLENEHNLMQMFMLRLLLGAQGSPEESAALYEKLFSTVKQNLSVSMLQAFSVFYSRVDKKQEGIDEQKSNQFYKDILSQTDRLRAQAESRGDKKLLDQANTIVGTVNEDYRRGQILDKPAAELHFTWSSNGEWKTLSELKGKVIVLDFWATWCGPCVGAFPNVRELEKRYKGYPVEIIGVTSLQGRHIARKNGKTETIDTKSNLDMEYELMQELMRELDVTWDVAFTREPVFNPAYGVRGVPHVAIIDAEGRLRYNGLHPGKAPFSEAEKIDSLLKEAGLKCPDQPMEKTNYAGK